MLPNQDGGYVLSREDVFAKIDELLEVGGRYLVGFNGFNPRLLVSTTTATCSPRCESATATASSSTR